MSVGRTIVAGVTDTRGIVHPRTGFEHFSLDRFPPSPALAAFTDRFWLVRWDLPPEEVFVQPVLAHPCVNLVIEPDRAAMYGVPTVIGRQTLRGQGWALAVMFRPGGARVFLPGPATEMVDQVRTVEQLWGPDGEDLVAGVRAALSDTALSGTALSGTALSGTALSDDAISSAAQLMDDFLTKRIPDSPGPAAAAAIGAAELIAADRRLTTVEQLATRTGRSVRGLQRLFAEHVGLSPKQVVRRYRLLEAAEAAAAGTPVVWAEVAAELGFADQAHLTREFGKAFGVPPARYLRGS
ncbi:AraC family transcriptional regulator [Nakamurella silvestris]|nr:AraC family transcriptional regulator [Nakamurella silvestris]